MAWGLMYTADCNLRQRIASVLSIQTHQLTGRSRATDTGIPPPPRPTHHPGNGSPRKGSCMPCGWPVLLALSSAAFPFTPPNRAEKNGGGVCNCEKRSFSTEEGRRRPGEDLRKDGGKSQSHTVYIDRKKSKSMIRGGTTSRGDGRIGGLGTSCQLSGSDPRYIISQSPLPVVLGVGAGAAGRAARARCGAHCSGPAWRPLRIGNPIVRSLTHLGHRPAPRPCVGQ
jgi:hypothetical protein